MCLSSTCLDAVGRDELYFELCWYDSLFISLVIQTKEFCYGINRGTV